MKSKTWVIARIFLLAWAVAIAWIVLSVAFVHFVIGVPATGYYQHIIFFGSLYFGVIRPFNKYNSLRKESNGTAP